MRSIGKQGKDYGNYFLERLVKSLRKVKHFVDEYYFGEDHEKGLKNLEKAVRDHFSLAEVLRELDFFPEDYKSLNNYLWYPYQELGLADRGKVYWDIPLNDFLDKYKHISPFEDYLQEDTFQFSLKFTD